MQKTPKSLRLHIGLFGRTNVGKSSFLNLVAGQDVSIISPMPGTTTDVVEKTMELLPIGPVVFLDTAGVDDVSEIAELRLKKTLKMFERSDVALIVTEPNVWTDYERTVVEKLTQREIPVIIVVNKADTADVSKTFLAHLGEVTDRVLIASSIDSVQKDEYVNQLKKFILSVCPDDFLRPPTLIGDLVPAGECAVLIVPIDLEAPKGRLILPQVQTIRDALDNDAACLVVKEREYAHILSLLKEDPAIVVCDSQVVLKMVADTPPSVPCTTFSILFSRYKGNLIDAARGAAALERVTAKDKVLIAESCSHHPIEDDIGRVKIPRWIRQYVGGDVMIDVVSGKDYPDTLKEYAVVIHCGGCMCNRREMLFRFEKAKEEGVPITNYGMCIAAVQGVLKRVLSPFPAALDAYESAGKALVKGAADNKER